MNPVLIIPTYVSGRRGKTSRANVMSVYDHMTPLSQAGELPRCLESLRRVSNVGQILVLVVADPEVEGKAADKVRKIAQSFADLDITVIGADEMLLVQQRMVQLGVGKLSREISLEGYAPMRNLGLVLACALGFDSCVFVDDDEVIDDPDFMSKAVYGLGKLTRNGVPILAKTGFYFNSDDSYLSKSQDKWYNRFWQQGKAFNAWIEGAMRGLRLTRSNHVCGGCLALHREAFKRLSFDPWIVRGEDLDYMLDLRMYGSDIWFDNKWSLRHLPPRTTSEGTRFRQDIYRWLYEYRKMEYSRTQIDLLQVKPASLEPYPGPFLQQSVGWRICVTAILRSWARHDKKAYRSAAKAARSDAEAYAQHNCSKYFEFQRVWPELMSRIENDEMLKRAFLHGYDEDLGAANAAYANVDPGKTSEISLNLGD